MYPVMLDVMSQRCLVVGGGAVALRKVEGLVADGASVTVVASEPIEPLTILATAGKLVLKHRPYESGEAANHALVFAATDDREINRQVFEDAKAANIWVNVADDPELCRFHLPARVRRGSFQLTIASAGKAPFLVRRLRQLLEEKFGDEWAELLEMATRFRRSVLDMQLPQAEQERRFDRFFASTVDGERMQARVPNHEEAQAWVSAPGIDDKPS